ncbi:hypothetical protein [Mangrovibacterium marinum]|uniref:Uncharacterized protein n=1 Tax=Mangrovibacterium marinum TaxID=1639118 RepID=A0A2T5C150_9BACT|nr:hypothetical protein [Mangrovibacterium marinum]PTN08329.1 hypothetical protein C8N47_10964 [Mangrovibacterium marinum]
MNKVSIVCGILAMIPALFSCQSEEVLPIVNSDALILSQKIDGVTKYGLAFHTYANVAMAGVNARSESGEVYKLYSYNDYVLEFYTEMDEADFTTSLPETGVYTFSVTRTNGEELTVADELTGITIEPVELTTCEYEADNNRIHLVWDSSDQEDYSVVVLRNSEGTRVYYSSSLGSSVVSANISSSGWIGDYEPVFGESYTVELGLYAKEDGEDQFLEAKAITRQTVVWGE